MNKWWFRVVFDSEVEGENSDSPRQNKPPYPYRVYYTVVMLYPYSGLFVLFTTSMTRLDFCY